jgi:hypothetical protein
MSLTAIALSASSGQADDPQPLSYANSSYLQVWNVNTELMNGAIGNWVNAVMRQAGTSGGYYDRYPDVITAQEVSTGSSTGQDSDTSCQHLVNLLETASANPATGVEENYNCVVAHGSGRYDQNAGGGTAIIYRSDRLSLQTKTTATMEYNPQPSSGPPGNDACVVDGRQINARHEAVIGYFEILGTSPTKYVTVASAHLPTEAGLSPGYDDCTRENAEILDQATSPGTAGSSAIRIIAGDFNHPDRAALTGLNYEGWYKCANAELPDGGCPYGTQAWNDPVYNMCVRSESPADTLQGCLTDNVTGNGTGTPRVDYIFYNNGHGGSATTEQYVHTDDDSPHYSDHHSVGALLQFSAF